MAGRAARERGSDPSRREPSAGRIVGAGPVIASSTGRGWWNEDDGATGTLSGRDFKTTNHLVGAPVDAPGVRAPDGLAGRLDGRHELATALRASGNGNDLSSGDDGRLVVATLNSGGNNGGFRTEPGEHLVMAYRKATKAHHDDDWERWEATDHVDTLGAEGLGALAATAVMGAPGEERDLLPLGLDSHRYRCCGNGVVASVSEWIGIRLADVLSAAEAARQ